MKNILLLFAVLLLVSCRVRNSGIEKFVDAAKIDSSYQRNHSSSRLDRSLDLERSLEATEKTAEETETVVIRKYSLDKNGAPFLSEESTTIKSGKSKNRSKSEKTSSSDRVSDASANGSESGSLSYSKKSVAKIKSTSSDSTVQKNIGGWKIVFAVVALAILALFFRYRQRL